MKNFYTVFEISPLPTVVLDSKLDQLWENTKFSIMQENFLQGQSVSEALDQNIIKELKSPLKTSDINHKSPFEVKLKNGDIVLLVYFTRFKIFNEEFLLVTIFDITKNKQLEFDFVHLQKLQMLGYFLSSIIHDFNNLLTAIIGFSDILLTKNSSTSSSYEDIIQIKKNAIRSSNLVKKLLAFSRKETVIPKLINVTNCISDLYQLIKKLLGEKISLSIDQEEKPCFIKIDKTQFQQVIINLSINAKDSIIASERHNEGFLKISTSFVQILPDSELLNYYSPANASNLQVGDYVMVKIEDNGEGMTTEVLAKIFNPFFSTKSYGSSGTGLGLATIIDIVESVGGFIKVKTIFGEGTSFYLFFKPGKVTALNKVDHKDDTDFKNNSNITKKMHNEKNIKILVVEDENPVRLVTIQALKYQGYHVLDTSNGNDALKILEQNPDIDLVITDFMMGSMDGVELVQNIRKKYQELKIIITSGYTENALFYVKEHSCEFLSKPYSLKILNEKVERILE